MNDVKCEVKNIQSSEVFQVPPEGMIFGRTGGPANITVSDQSVSKRHARIYLKDGATWVLEDLKSVNGTVVNNRRITEPVPIQAGFVFALSKHQFEVVSVDGQNGASAGGGRGRGGNGASSAMAAEGGGSDPRRSKSSSAQRGGGRSQQPVPVADAEPMLPPEPSRARPSPPLTDEPADAGGDPYVDEAVQSAGAGAVIAALPKAIAYYLAAVPLMALNPIGTVRRGIEEMKLKPMGALELIAFILPVQIFGAVLVSWATAIGTLIGGGGFLVMSFIPIVPLVIAVVVSVISGFITHPLLKFFVERLFKGQTDERSRTNYMIMVQTASALLTVPTAVNALLVPVITKLTVSVGAAFALLYLIPALLSAVVTPLPAYVSWNWMKAFKVSPLWQKIFFVLMILGLLGGVFGAIGGVKLAITGLTSGGGGGTVVVTPPDGVDPTKIDVKVGEDGKPSEGEPEKPVIGDPPPGKDPVEPIKSKTPDPPPGKDPVEPIKSKTPDPPPPKIDDEPPAPKGSYGDYKMKRDFIERAIAEDPTLLKGNVGNLYRDLSKQTYRGIAVAEEEVLGKKKKYDPALKLYLEKVKEAKIYEETRVTVDRLYRELKR